MASRSGAGAGGAGGMGTMVIATERLGGGVHEPPPRNMAPPEPPMFGDHRCARVCVPCGLLTLVASALGGLVTYGQSAEWRTAGHLLVDGVPTEEVRGLLAERTVALGMWAAVLTLCVTGVGVLALHTGRRRWILAFVGGLLLSGLFQLLAMGMTANNGDLDLIEPNDLRDVRRIQSDCKDEWEENDETGRYDCKFEAPEQWSDATTLMLLGGITALVSACVAAGSLAHTQHMLRVQAWAHAVPDHRAEHGVGAPAPVGLPPSTADLYGPPPTATAAAHVHRGVPLHTPAIVTGTPATRAPTTTTTTTTAAVPAPVATVGRVANPYALAETKK